MINLINHVSDEQRAGRSPGDDQDEGAARGGEAHLTLHPHQATRPLRNGLRPGMSGILLETMFRVPI